MDSNLQASDSMPAHDIQLRSPEDEIEFLKSLIQQRHEDIIFRLDQLRHSVRVTEDAIGVSADDGKEEDFEQMILSVQETLSSWQQVETTDNRSGKRAKRLIRTTARSLRRPMKIVLHRWTMRFVENAFRELSSRNELAELDIKALVSKFGSILQGNRIT